MTIGSTARKYALPHFEALLEGLAVPLGEVRGCAGPLLRNIRPGVFTSVLQLTVNFVHIIFIDAPSCHAHTGSV